MQLQALGCRSGFLIGDGTGVGKGRQAKVVWISLSFDLLADASRDLEAVSQAAGGVPILQQLLQSQQSTPNRQGAAMGCGGCEILHAQQEMK